MPTPPRLSGRPLRALARAARTPIGAAAMYRILRSDLHIDELPRLADALRGDLPLDTRPIMARPPRDRGPLADKLALPKGDEWPTTSAALTRAYASGEATPLQIAKRALRGARRLAERKPSVGPILDFNDADALREAELATARYREGRALGPLDGVPVVLKEEMTVRGLPRRSGTRFVD